MESSPTVFPLDIATLTRENIRNCLPTAPELHNLGTTRIARVRLDIVVKYGPYVHISEANNMRLARQANTVNVPEVLDAWSDFDKDTSEEPKSLRWHGRPVTYIVMRYISGTLLIDKWPTLKPCERQALVENLATMLRNLQSISLTKPGPVGDRIKCCGYFFTVYDAGPFDTAKELEDWLNSRVAVCKDFNKVTQDYPSFHVTELVMSHMDLNPRNIIINDSQLWLLDWERAGGYPPYFEAENILHTNPMDLYGEFQRQLYDAFHEQKHHEVTRRLGEITFAFTTGALYRRSDVLLLRE